MGDRSVFPGPFLLLSIRSCHGAWRQGRGNITTCSATRRLASDRASLPCVLTALRKSHCITFKLRDSCEILMCFAGIWPVEEIRRGAFFFFVGSVAVVAATTS